MRSQYPQEDPFKPVEPEKDDRAAEEDPGARYDAINPNPADEAISGLEAGGGVPPGETPPASAQTAVDRGRTE